VFLIAYSIGDPNSFENIKAKVLPFISFNVIIVHCQWVSELKHYWRHAPWILLGTKADLRTDEKTISELAARGQAPITTQQVLKRVNQRLTSV
jgi:GTPase SAR1 family protein